MIGFQMGSGLAIVGACPAMSLSHPRLPQFGHWRAFCGLLAGHSWPHNPHCQKSTDRVIRLIDIPTSDVSLSSSLRSGLGATVPCVTEQSERTMGGVRARNIFPDMWPLTFETRWGAPGPFQPRRQTRIREIVAVLSASWMEKIAA